MTSSFYKPSDRTVLSCKANKYIIYKKKISFITLCKFIMIINNMLT